MSSLLDEAIVDAKALREAVLKNAEASLLEAYAPKIEEAVVQLLEQDPAAAALPMDIGAPPAEIGAMPGGLDGRASVKKMIRTRKVMDTSHRPKSLRLKKT